MFILMQSTVDQESAKGMDATFGVKVDGEWGGQWRVTVKDGAFSYEPADSLDGTAGAVPLQERLRLRADLFQRFPGARASGDPR